MRFQSIVQLGSKTATGTPVPQEVVSSLGPSKRPPVRVTINGHKYDHKMEFLGRGED
jgi:Domain of unknown function (DUF1905)